MYITNYDLNFVQIFLFISWWHINIQVNINKLYWLMWSLHSDQSLFSMMSTGESQRSWVHFSCLSLLEKVFHQIARLWNPPGNSHIYISIWTCLFNTRVKYSNAYCVSPSWISNRHLKLNKSKVEPITATSYPPPATFPADFPISVMMIPYVELDSKLDSSLILLFLLYLYQKTTSTQPLIYLEIRTHFSLWLLLPWPKWHQLSVLSWIMGRLLNGPYLFSLTFLSLTSLPHPHHQIYSLSPQQPKYKHYHINPLLSPFHLKKKTVSFNSLQRTLWLGAITLSVRMGYKDIFWKFIL